MPEPPMNKMRPCLLPESLPGIDIQDGLQRLGNDEEFYQELLLTFQEDYSLRADEIETALDQGDLDQACFLIHNIKGVAANVGALQLFEAAVQLEAALKSGKINKHKGLFDIFKEKHGQVLVSLDLLKPIEPEDRNTQNEPLLPQNQEKLLAIIAQYKPLIKMNKPKAAKQFMDEITCYKIPRHLNLEIDLLKRLIRRYDFKESLIRLEI
ncbi:MAG: Hpt domain-containing protein, partial [Desulfobacteraceae bacterium]|nr:Hpt domain-containing protein [Desulfobacteraceae bacterium]